MATKLPFDTAPLRAQVTTLLQPVVDTTTRGNLYLQQQLALAYN